MVWLVVEEGINWSSNSTQFDNQVVFDEFVGALQQLGQTIGVRTSLDQWQAVMGADYTAGSLFPLWSVASCLMLLLPIHRSSNAYHLTSYYRYVDQDNVESFADFVPFGGWATPAIKSYSSSPSLCGVASNFNWYQ